MYNQRHVFRHIKGDLFGGATAAVVALPLALAFGVSSGAGPIAGIYGAIFVGLFAALFGGTPTQISGPTGPMTVVMAAVFTQFAAASPEHGPAIAFTVVMMAGGFQIIFGLFKLGKYITMMPFPVISGFMSGIGVIIITLQLAPFLGHAASSSVLSALGALPEQINTINPVALGLGALTLVIVFACPKVLARLVPPPLLALFIATSGYLLFFPDSAIAVIGDIPTGFPAFIFPTIEWPLLKDMLLAAIMLAALGAIDSLLTSLVADNMTKTQHQPNRELVGQGIGNMVAGFFGGIPGAGATMRTVVNIRAGGMTALSGMTHSIILMLVVLGAGGLAEQIPHAVLAGILIKVGLDIIDWGFIKRLHHVPLAVVALMLLVLGLTVFVDLITAVAVGVFIANIITVKQLTDVQLESIHVVDDNPDTLSILSTQEKALLRSAHGQIILFHIDGPLSYAAVKGLTTKLTHEPSQKVLLFDLTDVPLLDVSTVIALEEMMLDAQKSQKRLYVSGMNGSVKNTFERMHIADRVPAAQMSPTRLAALEDAIKYCQ